MVKLKTIVAIATKGDRPGQLSRTIETLKGQADEIHVYDNSKQTDYTDNAKFYFLQFYKVPVYYFTCDDDLLYPPDYIKRGVEHVKTYDCIVSYHGRVLKHNRPTYYGADHEGYHHWKPVSKPTRIDVAGTGCTVFRTDYFNPVDIYKSDYKRMSDLVFSLRAWQEQKMIITPEKKLDYIVEQEVENSIFVSESRGKQAGQIELMNQIIKCKDSLGIITY